MNDGVFILAGLCFAIVAVLGWTLWSEQRDHPTSEENDDVEE